MLAGPEPARSLSTSSPKDGTGKESYAGEAAAALCAELGSSWPTPALSKGVSGHYSRAASPITLLDFDSLRRDSVENPTLLMDVLQL